MRKLKRTFQILYNRLYIEDTGRFSSLIGCCEQHIDMVKINMGLTSIYTVFILLFGYTVNGYILSNKQGKGPTCSDIKIITRAQWGARAPKSTENLTLPVPEFFIHHTDTPECFDLKACSAAVRGIQKFHMDYRGWVDIGYNFLVGEDGLVYEGRGWTHVGSHTKGYNSQSLGTSVIGDYMKKLPNPKALDALRGLIHCAEVNNMLYPNYRLYGHRDANNNTDCPGDTLYKLIQTWPHYSHVPPQTLLFEKYNMPARN